MMHWCTWLCFLWSDTNSRHLTLQYKLGGVKFNFICSYNTFIFSLVICLFSSNDFLFFRLELVFFSQRPILRLWKSRKKSPEDKTGEDFILNLKKNPVSLQTWPIIGLFLALLVVIFPCINFSELSKASQNLQRYVPLKHFNLDYM